MFVFIITRCYNIYIEKKERKKNDKNRDFKQD